MPQKIQKSCRKCTELTFFPYILTECPQNASSGTTFILCPVNGTMECVPDVDNDCVPDNEVKMLPYYVICLFAMCNLKHKTLGAANCMSHCSRCVDGVL